MATKFGKAVSSFTNALTEARKNAYRIDHELKSAMNALENTVQEIGQFDPRYFDVKVSVGAGNWAKVAWITVLDRSITQSTQNGMYISMLFNKSLSALYIGLGLGITRYQLSGYGRKKLNDHVEVLRSKIKSSELNNDQLIWQGDEIDFEAIGRLPDGYKAGTVFTCKYPVDSLPDDEHIYRYFSEITSTISLTKKDFESMQSEGKIVTAYPLDPQEELETLSETLFWDGGLEEKTHYALWRKKNIILQGAPGVGKTYWADILASRLNETNRAHLEPDEIGLDAPPPPEAIFRCQFHQSTGYEDFVQGYRPTPSGGFELKDGIFIKAVKYAQNNPYETAAIIIDEINRGNISKIFGELLSLIESDKRDEKWALSLTYSSEKFWIPPNLYVIGMMNTADKSLSVVDYALRRRFAFIDIKPGFDSPCFDYLLSQRGLSKEIIIKIKESMSLVNSHIAESPQLGRGFQIGHNFFIPSNDISSNNETKWYQSIVENEIRPLLKEYFYDEENELERLIDIFSL